MLQYMFKKNLQGVVLDKLGTSGSLYLKMNVLNKTAVRCLIHENERNLFYSYKK